MKTKAKRITLSILLLAGFAIAQGSNDAVSDSSSTGNTDKPQQKKSHAKARKAAPQFSCEGKTKCAQMNSCSEAVFYLEQCGVTRLDRDRDGVPCEKNCN